MQPHVQERIRLAFLGRVIAVECCRIRLEQLRVLRMQRDDADDLVLDRLDRQRLAVLAPGLDVHAPQRRTALVVEERHQRRPRAAGDGLLGLASGRMVAGGSVLSLKAHRSTSGQRWTLGFACLADIAAVQQQPVMRVEQVLRGNDLEQAVLDCARCVAAGKAQAVRDAEDVRVHGHRGQTEGTVEHDVRRLASHARQFLEGLPIRGHAAAMALDQQPARGEDVLHLARIEADRLHVGRQPVSAQREDLLRRVGDREQFARRDVHALVGGLRREDHRDQQFERRARARAP